MVAIAAVILSAGESQRMGTLKPLLPLGKKTLLKDQVERIEQAGISNTYVVVGFESQKIIHAHKDLDVTWITNEDYKLGNFSSIKTALKNIADDEYEGCLLLPIDVAGVPVKTIRLILETGVKKKKNIIPEFNDKGGHPVYLSKDLMMDIAYSHSFGERLDKILNDHPETERLHVISREILNNINTQDDWKNHLSSLTN